MSDAVFPISATTLQLWFDPGTFQRARAYWQAGKVIKLEYNEELTQITAQVWGEALTPYRQYVSLKQHGAEWRLTDSCTCPVSGRCKHVLAVLLKLKQVYEQQQTGKQQLPLRQLNQWFNDVERLHQTDPSVQKLKDVVLYILSYGQSGLQLYPRRVKVNKKGGYTKGQTIGPHEFSGYLLPYWIEEQDFRLINLFRSQNIREQSLLEDGWGYQLLQQLLATGRCFFGEARHPLQQGQPRQLQLTWLEGKAGHQLMWDLGDDAELEIVYTDPPCYLDTTHFVLGPLATDLTGRELKLLSRMPPVPLEVVQDSVSKLQKLFGKVSLPVPAGVALERLDVTPVPVLQLRQWPVLAVGKVAAARLSFAYAEHLLPLDLSQSQTEISRTGRTVFIKRQRAVETAALERLLALGLVELSQPDDPEPSLFGVGDGPENPQLWQPLLQSLPDLMADGWRIEQADDFNLNILTPPAYLQVQDGKKGGFELGIQVDIDGQQVPLLPLITQWLRQYGLPTSQQHIWLSLPQGKLALPVSLIQPLIDTIVELLNLQKTPLLLELPDYKAALLPPPGAAEIQYLNAGRLERLSSQLHHFAGISAVSKPAGLQAELRPYQQQGLNWLCFLRTYGLGGVLADDMGLGKTLQTLSYLQSEREAGRLQQPVLIVCPTSLLGNWQQEAARFTPQLSVLQLYGPKRQYLFEQLADYDIIVTSYPLLVRDIALYQRWQFSAVILDEAQHIKNSGSQAAQSVRLLKADFKLALSGTPLENHLGELKSLFDFVLPGLLGTEQHFQQVYRKPIEKHADAERAAALKRKIAPFILRRTKNQVATELPEKTEILQLLELESDQRNLYESIRLVMETKVRELFLRKGVAASQIEFLDALLKLRQACCDARLVPIEQAKSVKHNAKLQWLRDNLPEMVEEGRKILLFSQFASMLNLIEQELQYLDISYSKLTGQTKKRQEQIDAFQLGGNSVFLISLKAGGTGLNLTAADTVIHYDPWWNPAAENQATDRAHRIGQDKAVFVYKLIVRHSVEEKVQKLQQFKQGLADQLFAGGKGQVWQGNAMDLLALFSEQEPEPLVAAATTQLPVELE